MAGNAEPRTNARVLLMLARTGFLVSLLLGVGGLFGMYAYGGAVLWLHIIFGLLFLVPAWMLPAGAAKPGRVVAGAAVSTIGAALAAVAALWAPGLTAWPHLILMIAAIGLLEMGAGGRRKGA